jgi:integrase/recombinase XerD
MTSRNNSRHEEITVHHPTQLVPEITLSALIDSWDSYLKTELAITTRLAYLKGLRLFRAWLENENLNLASVRPSDIRRWREMLRQEYAVQTVNLWLSAIRRFYAFLVEEYDAPILNPAAAVRGSSRRGNTRRHKRDELTTDEVRAVLETCDNSDQGRRDYAILSLMSYCALRTAEVQRVDLKNLQTRDGRTVLWVKGKGHVEADDFVVLPKPAVRAIKAWLKVRGRKKGPLIWSLSNQNYGDRLTTRALRGMVKNRFNEASVIGQQKTTHSLRHSAISNAIRNGAEPLQVQAMARHKSYDTTLNYYHELNRIKSPAEDLITY